MRTVLVLLKMEDRHKLAQVKAFLCVCVDKQYQLHVNKAPVRHWKDDPDITDY